MLTQWTALAISPGAFLCMPPPCPANSSGEPTAPDVGDHSTPLMSSRVKLRSMTPFDDVSEVNCMVGLSGLPCSGAPGDTYVYRPTANTSGSTHMVLSFMGLTSSPDVT